MIPDLNSYVTPYKLGRSVIEPSRKEGAYDAICTDVPFVFYHNDKFWMMHVGFDGHGYQTALACADAPEGPFEDVCLILKRGEGNGWDTANAAGVWMLSTQDLFTTRTLKKWDGKYWLYYHSYPGDGYEEGAAAIGIAWCDKEDLSEWHRLPDPILTAPENEAWDHGGLYKNCTVEYGGKYYLFYNAKNMTYGSWKEQIGICVGDDPLHFTRLPEQPAVPVGAADAWDSIFASDPWVVYSIKDNLWVMYYYGYSGVHAGEGIAFSRDLVHWEKAPEPIIMPDASGAIDDRHAHKPAILWYKGVLYHYYCCVQDAPGEPYNERRTITVAASKPWN